MSVRHPAVAGQFYPATRNEIEAYIERFNRLVDEHADLSTLMNQRIRAVIVPHAGYVYSGFTANVTLRLLSASKPKRLVIIGPSHRVYFRDFSVGMYDSYDTPEGRLTGDETYAKMLVERFGGGFYPDAHAEHSTEVQMPLIKHYLPDAAVVEIVYGDIDPKRLAPIIEAVLSDEDNAVVISTDLSHYYDIEKAKRLDSVCLNAIATLDTAMLHQGCEACGKIGVEAMLIAAKKLGLQPHIVDYRTSADASGDRSQVVGYTGVVFTES